MNNNKNISVIIPVTERYSDVRELYHAYKSALDSTQQSYEIVYVLDGEFPDVSTALIGLKDEGEQIKIVKLAKWFGEAVALTAGFENSSGDIILTLPAYYQVEASEIPGVLEKLGKLDMVIGRRWPRTDAAFNRLQGKAFHWIFNKITDREFHDLGCGVRAFKRHVITEVPIYGDQHRFLPVLANRRGFRIDEIKVQQSDKDKHSRIYRPGVYLRRMLDILTVFFLVKFTKKPLRFFGLIGSGTFILGGLILLVVIFERLFGGVALADRPVLLLSSLMVVLGVQLFALGLIGELIIFTHAKRLKEYAVEEIVN